MTRRLSPLILPLDTGNVTVDLAGAEVSAEAGTSNSETSGDSVIALGPLGLPGLYKRPAELSFGEPIGAQAGAEAGNVSVNLGNPAAFSQLGPWILPGRLRTVVPLIGSATINLVGATAVAQGEELEGADAIVYIDGATAFANGAPLPTDAAEVFSSAPIAQIFISGQSQSTTVYLVSPGVVVPIAGGKTFISGTTKRTTIHGFTRGITIQLIPTGLQIA